MARTTLLAEQTSREVVLQERVTGKPFRVIPLVDPAVYDDPDFVLTISIQTFDPDTGRTRGTITTHRGKPMGKSGRWACGMLAPPPNLRSTITISASKPHKFSIELEEAEASAPRTVQEHHSIAFDEFDYAETSSSADTQDVTGVTVDSGDFLVALVSVFNTTGSTMAVSDATNGTWTVPSGSPVLPDASSQAHIQYFTNSAALSAASITFDPVGTSSDIDAVVCEISGAATSGFDQYVEATGAWVGSAGFTASVTTATLAQANNLIFSVMTHTGASTNFGEDASFTLIAEDTDNAGAQAFHSQRLTTATSATTAVTVTATGDILLGDLNNYTWGIATIVVKEAAAGGAATNSGWFTNSKGGWW